VEGSCDLGNEPWGSIKCTTCGLVSYTWYSFPLEADSTPADNAAGRATGHL
jgi:hypothetical protein